jgi:hypothetical protein
MEFAIKDDPEVQHRMREQRWGIAQKYLMVGKTGKDPAGKNFRTESSPMV